MAMRGDWPVGVAARMLPSRGAVDSPFALETRPMRRAPSVLLLAGHDIAARAARASLGASADIVGASPVGESATRPADVVVVEQTLGDPPSGASLAALAGRTAGAPILSVVADGGGTYRWLRVRSAEGWFRIEATGRGTLRAAVEEAVAAAAG
jgi:hypothetical protein